MKPIRLIPNEDTIKAAELSSLPKPFTPFKNVLAGIRRGGASLAKNHLIKKGGRVPPVDEFEKMFQGCLAYLSSSCETPEELQLLLRHVYHASYLSGRGIDLTESYKRGAVITLDRVRPEPRKDGSYTHNEHTGEWQSYDNQEERYEEKRFDVSILPGEHTYVSPNHHPDATFYLPLANTGAPLETDPDIVGPFIGTLVIPRLLPVDTDSGTTETLNRSAKEGLRYTIKDDIHNLDPNSQYWWSRTPICEDTYGFLKANGRFLNIRTTKRVRMTDYGPDVEVEAIQLPNEPGLFTTLICGKKRTEDARLWLEAQGYPQDIVRVALKRISHDHTVRCYVEVYENDLSVLRGLDIDTKKAIATKAVARIAQNPKKG